MSRLVSGIVPEVERLTGVAQQLVSFLTDEELNSHPAEGKWSIAQNLQHLAVSNRLYSAAMSKAVATAPTAERQDRPLRGGWLSRWLAREMEPPVRKRYRAPESILPGTLIDRQSLVHEFMAGQKAVCDLAEKCWFVDINRVRFPNPFVKLLRFQISGGLLILTAHLRRHLWQAEQIALTLSAAKGRSQYRNLDVS